MGSVPFLVKKVCCFATTNYALSACVVKKVMDLIKKLHNSILYLDGGTGTLLQEMGLKFGELPEEWNISHSQEICNVHRAYFEAGADVVCANTFGANQFKFGDRLEEVIFAAVNNAKNAAKEFKNKFVALDIGSLGKMLKPLGTLPFEEAVNAFKRTICAGVLAGVDLILIETMNDVYELKAAVIAAKESCNLPIFATCVFGEDEKTMTGSCPEAVVALLRVKEIVNAIRRSLEKARHVHIVVFSAFPLLVIFAIIVGVLVGQIRVIGRSDIVEKLSLVTNAVNASLF